MDKGELDESQQLTLYDPGVNSQEREESAGEDPTPISMIPPSVSLLPNLEKLRIGKVKKLGCSCVKVSLIVYIL